MQTATNFSQSEFESSVTFIVKEENLKSSKEELPNYLDIKNIGNGYLKIILLLKDRFYENEKDTDMFKGGIAVSNLYYMSDYIYTSDTLLKNRYETLDDLVTTFVCNT